MYHVVLRAGPRERSHPCGATVDLGETLIGLECILDPAREATVRMLILAAVLGTTVLTQSDERVYRVGDPGVTTPVLTHQAKAHYTGDAMRRKVSGTVVLGAVVKTDGAVRDDVRVIESLDPDLDAESVRALKLWTFKPGTKDDKPVNVSVRVEMTFVYR